MPRISSIIYLLYSRLAGAPCEREGELMSPEKDSRSLGIVLKKTVGYLS